MRKILLFAVLALSPVPLLAATGDANATATAVPTAPASAGVDPAKLAKAQAIIAVAMPPAQRDAMIDQVLAAIVKPLTDHLTLPAGFDDPGLRQLFIDFVTSLPQRGKPIMSAQMPALLDAMARAYTRAFSDSDLDAVLAFARTPAGATFMSRANTLMQDPDVQVALGNMMGAAQADSMQAAQGFQQKLADYLKTHPEAAKHLQDAAEAHKGK